MFVKDNKPRTAQVGAISKAQKDSKTTFSTTGDNKSSQKTKNSLRYICRKSGIYHQV